jgi:hypothetical protein
MWLFYNKQPLAIYECSVAGLCLVMGLSTLLLYHFINNFFTAMVTPWWISSSHLENAHILSNLPSYTKLAFDYVRKQHLLNAHCREWGDSQNFCASSRLCSTLTVCWNVPLSRNYFQATTNKRGRDKLYFFVLRSGGFRFSIMSKIAESSIKWNHAKFDNKNPVTKCWCYYGMFRPLA